MDINNRESAADVRSTISDKAADAKDALHEAGERAVDKLNESRKSTARAMRNASASLHSGVDRVSDIGHSAAERLQASADYVRESDFETFVDDLQNLFRRYPVQMVAGAAIVGFLVVRAFRRLA